MTLPLARSLRFAVASLVCALASGCGVNLFGAEGDGTPSPASDGGGGSDGGAVDTSSCDYNSLEATLSARSSMFLGPNVQNLAAVGTELYWYDTTNYAPVLDSDSDGSGATLAYTFDVGDSIDDANYVASISLVVTAQPTDSGVTYYAYDPTRVNHLVGSTMTSAPDGASYWAYAVDGDNVYLVMTDQNGDNALIKWVPRVGSAQKTITTLESAGVTVGEFDAFGVSGNTMVFIASGALWSLDIPSNKATPLMNTTEVSASGSVDFESDGVMFATDTDLMFFEYASSKLLDISDEINSSTSIPCATGMGASNYSTDFTRWGSAVVVYIGQNDGVFAFNMTSRVITPVLLPPQNTNTTIQYRYPVALSDGKLFVTGLTSDDGSTGAEGPTLEVDLSGLVP
jgi:hypothetical protein